MQNIILQFLAILTFGPFTTAHAALPPLSGSTFFESYFTDTCFLPNQRFGAPINMIILYAHTEHLFAMILGHDAGHSPILGRQSRECLVKDKRGEDLGPGLVVGNGTEDGGWVWIDRLIDQVILDNPRA